MEKRIGVLLIALLLVGCSGAPATETVPADEVPVVAQSEDTVVAEGVVEPARWTELRAEKGGKVIEVPVEEGDTLSKGDLLVQLDPTGAELGVQEAEAALALAKAQLTQAKAGARPEEIAVTEAQLEAARSALAQAEAQRDRLAEGEASIEIAGAQAALAAAQAEQRQAYNLHEQMLECFTFKLPGGSEKTICPTLGRPEEYTRYAWHAAEDRLDAAEAQLQAAKNRAGTRFREAEAAVASAKAGEEALQSRLDLQKAGSRPERIAAAEAEVAKAEAALAAARAALEKTSIRAPFNGTVAEVNVDVGDTAAPGQVCLTVAALGQLRVRTKDLIELDVVRVAVGHPVEVTLDALPDRPIEGHVARIDGQSEDYRGDVTYPVIIELEEDVPELRWGMTSLVEIEVE